MDYLELLEKAVTIAVQAHHGQKDRYGAPFILHPLRVMQRVTTTEARIVAILHDAIEKTDWSFEQLQAEGFPQDIIEALRCLTKNEGEDYDQFVRRSAGNPLARQVKIADLEDNMDVRRMPRVSAEDQARFERYLRAWNFLQRDGSSAERRPTG